MLTYMCASRSCLLCLLCRQQQKKNSNHSLKTNPIRIVRLRVEIENCEKTATPMHLDGELFCCFATPRVIHLSTQHFHLRSNCCHFIELIRGQFFSFWCWNNQKNTHTRKRAHFVSEWHSLSARVCNLWKAKNLSSARESYCTHFMYLSFYVCTLDAHCTRINILFYVCICFDSSPCSFRFLFLFLFLNFVSSCSFLYCIDGLKWYDYVTDHHHHHSRYTKPSQ